MPPQKAVPLFQKIDALHVPVPDLEAGLAFYRDQLGHALIWRTATAAGLRLPGTDAELVLQTERPELEANLVVPSADDAEVVAERCYFQWTIAQRLTAEERQRGQRSPWRLRRVSGHCGEGWHAALTAAGRRAGGNRPTAADRAGRRTPRGTGPPNRRPGYGSHSTARR